MVAMRTFSPKELEAALKAEGCVQTDTKTATSAFWFSRNNVLFSVPEPNAISGRHSSPVYYRLMQFAKDN